MMKATGWHIEGEMPNEPKFVIIVAPHTSNWDFPVGLWVLFALGFKGSFLAKHSLFKWGLGPFMRGLGGVAIDRDVHKMRVRGISDSFLKSEEMILVIAPEGTRKYVKEWKTGFYYIADGAKVPVVPVAFDYATKAVKIGPPFRTTGDRAADVAELKKFFRGVTAKNPANFAV